MVLNTLLYFLKINIIARFFFGRAGRSGGSPWLALGGIGMLVRLLLLGLHMVLKIPYLLFHLPGNPENGHQEIEYKPVQEITKQYPEKNT
jgi:hypothetical protein